MENSFYIGAYWGSRSESLKQVTNKVLQTFEKLSDIDEQFLNWYEGGVNRKQALKTKVAFNNETIERLCLEKVKNGELDEKGFAKMGFLFGLWTGHSDEESSSITFSVGASFKSPHLCNSCVLKIPFEGTARERLLRLGKARLIISTLVEIWKPDYAVLTSRDLNDRLAIVNDVGWITYRKTIKQIPKISSKVVYEKANGGHWFYFSLESNNYDSSIANELLPIKNSL